MTKLKHVNESREAKLRRKLVTNEMNPIADALLSSLLFIITPFIMMFGLIHDKLMFKFLNRTYIYNVSWEVRRLSPNDIHHDTCIPCLVSLNHHNILCL